jgi:acyl carrier protein phosphodiesterase
LRTDFLLVLKIKLKLNYLAHAFLSFNDEKILVGNLLGDFVKGRKQLEKLPLEIQQGIILHRKIDAFTDSHKMVKQSIKRLKPTQKRYASVVSDIFYDYFLSKNWKKYTSLEIQIFANQTYLHLEGNYEFMSERPLSVYKKMIAANWLVDYGSYENIDFVMGKLSNRIKNPTNLHQAVNDLKTHEIGLNEDFIQFFPELMTFAKKEYEKILDT